MNSFTPISTPITSMQTALNVLRRRNDELRHLFKQILFNITIIQRNQDALHHVCVTDGNTESTIYSFVAHGRSGLCWMGGV